jgi:hypothetical protein
VPPPCPSLRRCRRAGRSKERRGDQRWKNKDVVWAKIWLSISQIFWCIIRNMRDKFNRTAPHGGVRKRLNTVGLVDSSCVQRLNPLSISVN